VGHGHSEGLLEINTGYITMKLRIAILVITLLFAATCTTRAASQPIDSSNVNYALSTKETAPEKALQYTGFDKLEDFSKSVVSSVDLVVIEDDRTPFAADKTNGREIRKVKLDNVVVGKGSKKIGRDFGECPEFCVSDRFTIVISFPRT
jgi:hypothetical protein